VSFDRRYVRWLDDLSAGDVAIAGGKNASLGEMIRELGPQGVRVPEGFATTAEAYRAFIEASRLRGPIRDRLAALERGERSLRATGSEIREMITAAELPAEIATAVRAAYRELGRRCGDPHVDVAVRSSATAEDLPEASFAGQQETYLNIRGEEDLLDACRKCFASLFTDRAISYREQKGIAHAGIALSVGVQKMVRSDLAGAGVMFTLDTETGFPDLVLINAAWGLGETVVKGTVNPDQYTVFKPFLDDESRVPIVGKSLGRKERKLVYGVAGTEDAPTPEDERRAFVLADDEILRLARWGAVIERHYGRPMDVEWAKDGTTGEMTIVQARPETVQSGRQAGLFRSYTLKEAGERLVTGLAIGDAIAAGRVQIIRGPSEMDRFEQGGILVTERTDPDWVPLMKRAAGIVTDQGGRTSHAAIVSRELGIPAVIGTRRATTILEEGLQVTLSCAEGDEGHVYRGRLDFEVMDLDLEGVPETETPVLMNVASPAAAMRWWRLPCRGVGLARIEYIVNAVIQVHPMALLQPEAIDDDTARAWIEERTAGYEDRGEYFVERLAWGIGTIAASRFPDPVIVRTSDFKTNEYAQLIGGRAFEPPEENPMLGWRGASRYYSDEYREAFALECRALERVRDVMGFDNVVVMIPFCRTPEEGDRVLAEMARSGLVRGENGLRVYVMAEIPSNILEAESFAERFDGFSIGSNDLTQLVLGVDRDAASLAYLFDERRPSIARLIRMLITAAHAHGRPVGICGQAPSDYPEFTEFLVEQKIDSISLNPDRVLDGIRLVAEVEERLRAAASA